MKLRLTRGDFFFQCYLSLKRNHIYLLEDLTKIGEHLKTCPGLVIPSLWSSFGSLVSSLISLWHYVWSSPDFIRIRAILLLEYPYWDYGGGQREIILLIFKCYIFTIIELGSFYIVRLVLSSQTFPFSRVLGLHAGTATSDHRKHFITELWGFDLTSPRQTSLFMSSVNTNIQ